jgi:hypothetical protein
MHRKRFPWSVPVGPAARGHRYARWESRRSTEVLLLPFSAYDLLPSLPAEISEKETTDDV